MLLGYLTDLNSKAQEESNNLFFFNLQIHIPKPTPLCLQTEEKTCSSGISIANLNLELTRHQLPF